MSEREVKIYTEKRGRPRGVTILGGGARETPVKIVSPTRPRDRTEDERETKPEYGQADGREGTA
jgi:hypothetical protein